MLRSQGRKVAWEYFIPNLHYWATESLLYPFIGGDAVEVKIQIKDPGAIGYIYDNFGNVKIHNENGVITTTLKSNESALVYWLLQYGEHFKVLEPLSFKEKLIEKAKKIMED